VSSAFWHTVAGIVIGGLISTAISYYFARESSKELRNQAERLRRYNDALLTYLDAAGEIHPVQRNEAGDPISPVIVRMEDASLEARGESAEVTVDEDKPPEGERQEGD
jgi:gas vesicle protein